MCPPHTDLGRDDVIAFAKGRSLERIRAFDLAAQSYRRAAERDGPLRQDALASAAVCDALAEADRIGGRPGATESLPISDRDSAIEKLGSRPAPLNVGDTISEPMRSGGKAIFWTNGVHPVDANGNGLKDVEPLPVGDPQVIDEETTLQILRYGVVPQVIPPFLSFTIYRWDINVRMSTIIGFVGGGGIGYILKPRVDLGQWGEVGTLVILIAITVWAMDILSARIREKIV